MRDSRGLLLVIVLAVALVGGCVTFDRPDAPLITPSSATVGQEVRAEVVKHTDLHPYRFDFGDGTITDYESSPSAKHTYTQAGSYSVKSQQKCPAGLWKSKWSKPTIIVIGAPGLSALKLPIVNCQLSITDQEVAVQNAAESGFEAGYVSGYDQGRAVEKGVAR